MYPSNFVPGTSKEVTAAEGDVEGSDFWGLYRGYIGIVEKKMEATIV